MMKLHDACVADHVFEKHAAYCVKLSLTSP